MKVTKTLIEGVVVIEPRSFEDSRGFFFEAYNKKTWQEAGLEYEFVQDNISFSHRGVLRGLHLQTGESAQAKLVSVMQGKVLDVVVDLRKDSPTFKKYFSAELSFENKKQILVPRGCAHGFVALSDSVIFSYKCDNFYDPSCEVGLSYNDPEIGVDWLLSESEIILAEKDLNNWSLAKVLVKLKSSPVQ